MTDLFNPLTDNELKQLDELLFNRFDDETDDFDKDEGVIDLSELDGFFTAIVSGPVMILPSQWASSLWGDFEPVWETEKEFEQIFILLMRHMNSIADHLMNEADTFEPLFLQRVVEETTYTVVDEWCEGYMRGVALGGEEWMLDDIEMRVLLTPIRAFQGEQVLQIDDEFEPDEIMNLQNAITPNVREIHSYWLARRQDMSPKNMPFKRSGSRLGRNDPCPCGSGKKYKKCCLH